MSSKSILLLVLAAALCGGCRSVRLPSVNTSAPGWKVQHGQAIWRPGTDKPEIAGEVLLATRGGESFLQFTKNPLPFVTTQTSNELWAIHFVQQRKKFSGRGTPTPRLMWVHLARGLSGGTVQEPLRFERGADGQWTLKNEKTGERVQGFLE